MQALSLFELNALVRSFIEEGAEDTYWVHGELLEGRVGYGGHFYGEMVEKNELSGAIVAKARITIWARVYNMLALRFQAETGQSLRAGLKVLMKVKLSFSELYGYALNVIDIDGSYTLGDQARQRQEILKRLTEDGIIDDNKTLPLPALLKRIAVVSSSSAAGYGDFRRQLLENEWGLAFRVQLFPAVMQGQHVPDSIAAALTQISDEADHWDAVVIIRGGGATSDLSDYDSYPLAACIAQHPLPVIVGVGHDRDETVLDHVAHTSVKTPTAAAAFILDHQCSCLARLQDLQQRIPIAATSMMQLEDRRLALLHQRLPSMVALRLQCEHQRLERTSLLLPVSAIMVLEKEKHRLDMLSHRLESMNPELLLKRGYSITIHDGKIVTHASQLVPGQTIVTRLQDGEVTSKVVEAE
ncbi:MAG: exodeoxyribonuclease VII large subunit [Bacteroidaceae bacterium]|nr:exodeoxyribonuclease VII large subunit [Bacteroidaceae bacterium]